MPLVKVDASNREVYGVMAEEAPDKSGEIFDYDSSKPYVKQWVEEFERSTEGKSFGNVRSQHGKVAAGKLIGVTFDDTNKRIPVVAKIVDDNEWQKVLEGVYTGFSIGGSYVKRWSDGSKTRYTARPREVSIVDNPCMYGAKFSLVKANSALEEKRFYGTASPELRQVMNDTREKLEILRKRITEILEQRAAVPSPTRFSPLDKDALAQAELRKALANPKPAHFDNEGTSVFKTVESVAPCVQMYSETIPVAAADVATEVRTRSIFEPRG